MQEEVKKKIWGGKTILAVLGIVVAIVIGVVALFLFSQMSIRSRRGEFSLGDGYVISSTLTEDGVSSTRQYFDADTYYKISYNGEVEFKNTSGEEVRVEPASFVHYLDGSIGILKKVALLNLGSLKDSRDSAITYYNLYPPAALRYISGSYVAELQGERTTFDSVLMKASDNKYLVAGPEITVEVGSVVNTFKNGYLEISYFDGDIVRVENQEITYQGIAEDMNVTVAGVKLDLRNKIVSKNSVAVLDLGMITIDSSDNIALSDYDWSEEEVAEEESEESGSGEEGQGGQESGTETLGDILSDLANGIIESSTEAGEINEYERSNDPTFTITSFDVTANSFTAEIEVEDKDGLLTGDTSIEVIEVSTGNAMYQARLIGGETFFEVNTENLSPETNYAFTVTSGYMKDNIELNRTFIQKTFITEAVGISLTENYVTTNSINVTVGRSQYSRVKSLIATLYDASGNIIENSRQAEFGDDNQINMTFSYLSPNTNYRLVLSDFQYLNMVVTNGFSMSRNITTLKRTPKLGSTTFTIDKRESVFNINVGDIVDQDNGIKTYRYEVYDQRYITIDSETGEVIMGSPVLVVEKDTRSGVVVPVDDETIMRGVPYVFRLVAVFNDNVFEHEYTTEISNSMKMDGGVFPVITFIEDDVTFERIFGKIVIIDDDGVINMTRPVTVEYKDSVGGGSAFTTTLSSSMEIPFRRDGLRKNESYVISVYAAVDLNDGNPEIDNCYIGSVIIQTKDTNPFSLNYSVVESETSTSAFLATARLVNGGEGSTELEADTLSGLTFNIYEGSDTTNLKWSTTVTDDNGEPYESDLRTTYYDSDFTISPALFGLRNKDFSAGKYTIQVTGAYDYTEYKNSIPIKDNIFTVEVSGSVPDLPVDPDNAVTTTTILNKNAGDYYDAKLNDDTIVGYSILADFDNSSRMLKEIVYQLHAADGTVVREYNYVMQDGQTVVNPMKVYLDGYGTSGTTADTDFRRGNSYYFTYYAKIKTADGSIIDYPADGTILRSKNIRPDKQKPTFSAFPVSSGDTTSNWKYILIDTDHAITDQLHYSIDNRSIGSVALVESDYYRDLQLSNLVAGELEAYYRYRLVKTDIDVTVDVMSQRFEGIYTPTALRYDVSIGDNKALIKFNEFGENPLFDRIASVKVDICDSTGEQVLKTFNNVAINEDGVSSVNLSEMSELMGQELRAHVYAYYDTGMTGFANGNDRVALEYRMGSGYAYYVLKNEKLLPSVTRFGSDFYYTFNPEEKKLSITDVLTGGLMSLGVDITGNGVIYENSPTVVKTLAQIDALSSTFSFDTVIPGISVKEITPDLMKVNIKAQLSGIGQGTIKDNKVYIGLWKTESTWTRINDEEVPDEIFEVDLDGANLDATIEGLDMGSYYFFRIFANVRSGSDYEEMYLYDVDVASDPMEVWYRFVTLSQVEVKDISVAYKATSQADRNFRVTYSFESHISSISGIEYEVWSVDADGVKKEKINLDISTDTVISRNMTKNIEIPSGSGVTTGQSYKVFVIPYVLSSSGEREYLPETGSDAYHFAQLSSPFVLVKSSMTSGDAIKFTVRTIDRDKTVVGSSYRVRILDGNGDEISGEWDGQSYPVGTARTFTLNNVVSYSEYTFRVEYVLDTTNGGESSYRGITKSYKVRTTDVDPYVGTVSAVADVNNPNKIRLIFVNSSRLGPSSPIEHIRYIVYSEDGDGSSLDYTMPFIPSQVSTGSDVYYYYTLENITLSSAGNYYIQLQFLDDGGIPLTESSLEYLYMR